MLSVAHIFSCLHNQCSRSVDHFPSFWLTNDICSPAGSSCCCQLVFCSKEEHLFLRYDLWNVRWRQKSNLTLPLLSYSKPVDNVECCANIFSCLHNQCSRSVDHFPAFWLTNDICSPAGSACCCQLVFCSKEEHLFFATISESSDEDKNPIWLCPYWATVSLLTMLSVAHIFSCLHNQCSRSADHCPVLFVWPMTLAALQGLHVVVSLMSNCKTAALNCSDIVVVVLVSPTSRLYSSIFMLCISI